MRLICSRSVSSSEIGRFRKKVAGIDKDHGNIWDFRADKVQHDCALNAEACTQDNGVTFFTQSPAHPLLGRKAAKILRCSVDYAA